VTHDEHAFGLVFSRGCINATVSTVFSSLTANQWQHLAILGKPEMTDSRQMIYVLFSQWESREKGWTQNPNHDGTLHPPKQINH